MQRGGFTVRATGGEAASLCECTVSPCSFVERETGRRSKAGGAGAPCSEVGVFDSGNRKRARRLHGAGDPCMRSVFRPGNRGEDRHQVWATRAVRFVRVRGQPRERTSGMASGSMDGAREVVRETGRLRVLRESGNRNAEVFIAKATLPMDAGADRLRARATGLERRAHDKLTARATGAGEREHGKLLDCATSRGERAVDELDVRATVWRESGRDETVLTGHCEAGRRRENELIAWETAG